MSKRGVSKRQIHHPDRAKWEARVRGPGKFEGEAPYVPYFYDAFLDGGADSDNGDVLGFRVSAADRAVFPELRGRQWVRIRERSDGFVVEV